MKRFCNTLSLDDIRNGPISFWSRPNRGGSKMRKPKKTEEGDLIKKCGQTKKWIELNGNYIFHSFHYFLGLNKEDDGILVSNLSNSSISNKKRKRDIGLFFTIIKYIVPYILNLFRGKHGQSFYWIFRRFSIRACDGIVKILNLYIILLCTHLYHSSFQYLSINCNAFIACYIRR